MITFINILCKCKWFLLSFWGFRVYEFQKEMKNMMFSAIYNTKKDN